MNPAGTLTIGTGPFEVESALKSHPAVIESAVVGVRDAERGEVVKAFVVLSEAYQGRSDAVLMKELQDHCKREAAPYKYPRRIQFVSPEWLPKTISGKIQRAEIRQRERKATGAKL
jgi:acyl-coenzyme A synthetase/AMP-(fatty) acid ligase